MAKDVRRGVGNAKRARRVALDTAKQQDPTNGIEATVEARVAWICQEYPVVAQAAGLAPIPVENLEKTIENGTDPVPSVESEKNVCQPNQCCSDPGTTGSARQYHDQSVFRGR